MTMQHRIWQHMTGKCWKDRYFFRAEKYSAGLIFFMFVHALRRTPMRIKISKNYWQFVGLHKGSVKFTPFNSAVLRLLPLSCDGSGLFSSEVRTSPAGDELPGKNRPGATLPIDKLSPVTVIPITESLLQPTCRTIVSTSQRRWRNAKILPSNFWSLANMATWCLLELPCNVYCIRRLL